MTPPNLTRQAAESLSLVRLQHDIERLSLLPGSWKDLDPTSIAGSVLDVLLDMLALDFVGLRFNDTSHVFLSVAPDFGQDHSPEAIRAALDTWPDGASEVRLAMGDEAILAILCPLGGAASIGEIIAGARREGFPDRLERSKLQIAASQTGLACREMRELSDRKPPTDPRDKPLSETALAESEWRLHLTINTIPAMAWSTTPDGLIDFCNQNFVDFVGWTAEEISGQGFWPIFHPDDTAHLLAAWQEIMATRRPREVECRMRRADGEYRWFVLRQNPLFDAEGNVIKWYGAGTEIEDRKRAETALEEAQAALLASEQNLNLIINSLPVLVWSARPDGSADFINQSWRDYAGEPADKILEWGFLDLYHPDDVPGMMEIWTRDITHNDQTALKGRIRGADGQYRWFYFAGRKLTDANGVVRWFGCNVDIEDLQRAEDALRASEAALRESERALSLMLDTIPGMAWSTTAEGFADRFNKQFVDFVGLPAETLKGTGFLAQFHPDDVDRMFAEWQVMMASRTGGDIEGRARRADGEYRWLICRCSPLLSPAGEVVRWYGVNLDIEDRKRAEAAVVASERNVSLILDSLPVLIWSAKAGGSADFVNQRYLDYVGLPADRILDFGFADVIHPDDVDGLMTAWRDAQDKDVSFAQARIRRFDGEYRWFYFAGQKFADATGTVRWFGVDLDIEDLKRAEDHLRQSQNDLAHVTRMTTMGELAVSIAHEVNQPLMAIVTNAGACLRWLDGAHADIAMARQAAERIVRDGHRAGDIITSLRNLARKSAPRMDPVSLEQIIQVVLDVLQGEFQRHGVAAKVQLEGAPIVILGDTTQLQQVMLNLLMNAIEAMVGAGEGARRLIVHAQIREREALVSVTDTGPGLAADDADRLFEAFFSTKAEGIGMGLSICRSIIEAHGGRIWAAHNTGTRGGVFSFTLPLAEGYGVDVSKR